MEFDYEIVCYRVMYRCSKDNYFSYEDFSNEEKAFMFFKEVLNNSYEVKMLKIQGLVDWYER